MFSGSSALQLSPDEIREQRSVRYYPKGMRPCGMNGLEIDERNLMRVWTASAWLKRHIRLDGILKNVKGFWVDFTQGLIFKSPYIVLDIGGG